VIARQRVVCRFLLSRTAASCFTRARCRFLLESSGQPKAVQCYLHFWPPGKMNFTRPRRRNASVTGGGRPACEAMPHRVLFWACRCSFLRVFFVCLPRGLVDLADLKRCADFKKPKPLSLKSMLAIQPNNLYYFIVLYTALRFRNWSPEVDEV